MRGYCGLRRYPAEPTRCAAHTAAAVPFVLCSIPAGFPSPAEDYLDRPLDFNELLITHAAATFAVRITGNSMIDAGIHPGDIAVVNRALTPVDGNVILAIVNGDFTVKRFRRKGDAAWLEAANETYPELRLGDGVEFECFGVIKNSIRML